MRPRLAVGYRTLLGTLLGTFGCGGPDTPGAETAEAEVETEGARDTAASRPDAYAGDPLLAEARASVKSGQLPDPMRASIADSRDPAHARAKRILAVMDRQARGEPEPESADDDDDTPTTAPSLKPPDEDAPPVPEPAGDRGADGGAASEAAATDTPTPTKARLAVLTRLSLQKTGNKATLTVHAADAVRVGVATQASGKVRLVVESAGALPGFLQARPSVDGLAVSDVRRGQDTVQIAVDVGEGWKVGNPSSFSGGARLIFTRS
jgi:hypothetical protein